MRCAPSAQQSLLTLNRLLYFRHHQFGLWQFDESWTHCSRGCHDEQPILHRIRRLNVFELLAERPENGEDLQRYIATRLQTATLHKRIGTQTEAVRMRLARLRSQVPGCRGLQ